MWDGWAGRRGPDGKGAGSASGRCGRRPEAAGGEPRARPRLLAALPRAHAHDPHPQRERPPQGLSFPPDVRDFCESGCLPRADHEHPERRCTLAGKRAGGSSWHFVKLLHQTDSQ